LGAVLVCQVVSLVVLRLPIVVLGGAKPGVPSLSSMTWRIWRTREASLWARCAERGSLGRAGGSGVLWEVV
jgi:hypothetical protein